MKEIILNENVTVYRPEVADKQALKNVYDILNKINQRVHKNEYFYTPGLVRAYIVNNTRLYWFTN